MAKDKKGSKTAAAPPKVEVGKNVKAGRVSKPTEQPKAAAKNIAKKAANGIEKVSKKAKKAVTPPSETSDDDDADTSDSSDSSVDEVKPKANGKAKAPVAAADDSEDDSSDASDSEAEVATKKVALPKTNGKVDSDDDDESSASDSDEDEVPKINGHSKAAAASDSEDDSEDDSDDSESDAEPGANGLAGAAADDDDDSDDDSSEEEEEEEEEKPVKKAEDGGKKRKAEESIAKTPKKTKVMVEGEMKEATNNLFVGNLSWNVDEEWLTREFETFGELNSVRIITDRDSGRSKGFGYVEFNAPENAAEALESKQGLMLDGRNIRIDFSTGRQNKADGQTPQQRTFDRAQKYGDTAREPSMTLFVGNVSFDADEAQMTELFQEYGTITSVRLPTDRESGQLKGFGYVDFTSIDDAKAAYEGLQGGELAGRPMRLDYSTPRSNDSPRGGFGGRGGGDRGRGGFRGGDRGGFRGGRGGFGDRGGRGRGAPRGGRGNTTNRGGFGDFSGKKISF